MKYFASDISGKKFPESEKVHLMLVKSNIFDYIKKDHPEIDETKYIALPELEEYRRKYIENSLKSEFDNLSVLESEVIDKVTANNYISRNVDDDYSGKLTFGQKIADKVAAFGGSWKFIIFFSVFIVLWIAFNSLNKHLDPFPFILLNLLLSCLAAFQAPVIMMSQNRQEAKDRNRAKEDYKVNLKAEMEIRILQEKIDHLILVQQQKLFDIQNMQTDMLKDISSDIANLKMPDRKE